MFQNAGLLSKTICTFSNFLQICQLRATFTFSPLFLILWPIIRLRATRSQRRWRQSALRKMAPTLSPPETGESKYFDCSILNFSLYSELEQACQVLVPGVLAQCQIQGARTSHGKVCISFSSPSSSLSRLWFSSQSSTIRSAILGEQRNNYFCDVACGRGEMVSTIYYTQTYLRTHHMSPTITDKSYDMICHM